MAKMLVFCNKKGGPGKTTLGINVGAVLAGIGKVLVIDADPQQSAVKWANAAQDGNPFPMAVVGYTQEKVHLLVRQMADKHDYIIIDTPPSSLAASTITRSALMVADVAVIPVTPSPLDLWEVISMSEIIAEVNVIRESGNVPLVKPRLVINKLRRGTILGADIKDAISKTGIPTFTTNIHFRECYKHAVVEGSSVLSLKGNSSTKAAQEIKSLTQEILQTLL